MCSVVFTYGTYILEGQADANFSLSETWICLQNVLDPLHYSASVFCRQMINCMRACYYIQTTSSSLLSVKVIKHVRKIMMHKDVIERNIWNGIFRFHETKRDGPIMAATNLSGGITNSLEDRNGKICRLILAHVLIQVKCSLFLVL